MRHFLSMSLLASRVRKAAIAASLVSATCFPHRLTSRSAAAAGRAVSIAVVAARAQEEHLPAFRPATHDEAK
jgi:hypothetical protein